jgi:hypothetical protein
MAEAFDTTSGLPVSTVRESETMTWFDFACAYMDMKWPDSSPKYRKSLVESLVTITVPMLDEKKSLPEPKLLRKALTIALNTRARERDHAPEIKQAINQARRATKHVAALAEPDALRHLLRALDLQLL